MSHKIRRHIRTNAPRGADAKRRDAKRIARIVAILEERAAERGHQPLPHKMHLPLRTPVRAPAGSAEPKPSKPAESPFI